MRLLALSLITLLLAACVSAPQRPAEDAPKEAPAPAEAAVPPGEEAGERPLAIGLLLPLSGQDKEIGKTFLEAATLALFEENDASVRLIPRDSGSTPEAAAAAARSAIDEGAEILVGPYYSASVAAAAPLARERGVKMLAFSNSRSVAGGGVYLLGFLPELEVRRIVDYARQAGLKRFAALIPDTGYGHLVAEEFKKRLAETGGEIARIEVYPRDARGLDAHVRKLGDFDSRRRVLEEERANLRSFGDDDLAHEALARLAAVETAGEVDFDAVFLPEGGLVLKALAPLLPYYDIDPAKIRLLGTGLWDDPTIRSEPAMLGAWFAGPDPAAAESFAKRFSSVYGRAPLRLSSLAYDGVRIARRLGRGANRFADETIAGAEGFQGVDGLIRFHADGAPERALAVIEVRRDRFRVISQAPQSFPSEE